MKELYSIFDPQDEDDITLYFSQDNAKLVRDHLNSPWMDEEGNNHPADKTYHVGIETFKDEEWPTILRLLTIMRLTPETEEEAIKIIREHVEQQKKPEEETQIP